MKFSKILSQVKTPFTIKIGQDLIDKIEVEDVVLDSRLVKKNSAFFAFPGQVTDGSKFISDAIGLGASILICEEKSYKLQIATNKIFITCNNLNGLIVEFLQILYAPLPQNIYAVTGTNGKTSVAEYIRQILRFLGKRAASIGTLGVICDSAVKSQLYNSSLTTPDIVSLYKNLSILKKNQIDDVAVEVSSIGLHQGRINGLDIAVGSFISFSQDHLDYHQTMEEYLRCKMVLFGDILKDQSIAVLNADMEEYPIIRKLCDNKNHQVIDYGFNAEVLKIEEIEETKLGQKVSFNYNSQNYQFDLSLYGSFQAMNVLCALGNILAKNQLEDYQFKNILDNFHILQPAPGRMQQAGQFRNGAQVFIDFAHSPDALKNVLEVTKKVAKARVLVMFGCGGDRDAEKRPLMGKIASDLADFVIVTDDNPRCEDPAKIRQEILKSCDMSKTIEVDGRKSAIEKAISMLENNDILILAGKGHEKYQVIGDKKFEFDEVGIVENEVVRSSTNKI